MSMTKKKNGSTSKSTGSTSRKRSPSSKTRSSKSRATSGTKKSASSRSAEATDIESSLLSPVTGKQAGKNGSESSQRGNSRQKKSGVWDNWDGDEMPELTMEQLGTFRPAKSEKKAQLAQAGTIVVLDGETVVATRKVGRPQKSAQEKEMVRSIRLSESFLARLKARAEAAGYTGWQTYAKKLLEDALNA